MPARDEIPDGKVKVIFTRPNGDRGWIFVPADDKDKADRLMEGLINAVPDDATWTTEPHTPGLLPADKEETA